MTKLTHKSTNADVDKETMTLETMGDGMVTVYFDGDKSNTTTMDMPTYDNLVESDSWELA